MPLVTQKVVDSSTERNIITGLIVSDSFCKQIVGRIKTDFFTTSFVRTLVRWVLDFYGKYEQAPREKMQSIFLVEQKKVNEDDSGYIQQFLQKLSEDYVAENQPFDDAFYITQTIEYFRKRNLELLCSTVEGMCMKGDVDDAEYLVSQFNKVVSTTSRWEDPFSDSSISNTFEVLEDDFLSLPGTLGYFLGPFRREWLVSFVAPVKRGKTWFLLEMACQALFSRKKVVFVSLEMSYSELYMRLYKRISGMDVEASEYAVPCFDCHKNQLNTCFLPSRVNVAGGLYSGGVKPEYSSEMSYRPCAYCRGHKDKFLRDQYESETWFETVSKSNLTPMKLKKILKSLKAMFGSNLRVKCFPNSGLNIHQLNQELDMLQWADDFVPQVVIADYADIFAPEDSRLIGRERIDQTWRALKQSARERSILLVTATQGNRQSGRKKLMTYDDVSEDIRKMAHIDLGIFLSQTPKEKKNGIIRLSKFHRHSHFDEGKQVRVLQSLSLGQPLLDSDFMPFIREEPSEEEE